jgi:hypothetical protein
LRMPFVNDMALHVAKQEVSRLQTGPSGRPNPSMSFSSLGKQCDDMSSENRYGLVTELATIGANYVCTGNLALLPPSFII